MMHRISTPAQQCYLANDRRTSHAGFLWCTTFGLPSTASLADLEREGRRHCALDWEPLNAARGAEIHMDQYCFRCDPITAPSGS